MVCTEAYFTSPPMRVSPPPSARQYSASIFGRCWFTMNWIPTRVDPSSPASARKMTSRSRGTLILLSCSMSIRAAAIDVAGIAGGAERRKRPFLRVDVHGVGMGHDQERTLLSASRQTGDEIRPMGLEGEHLDRYSLFLEDLFEVIRGRLLAPRGIRGVESQERLKVLHRLGLEPGPVRGLSQARICREAHEKKKESGSLQAHGPG